MHKFNLFENVINFLGKENRLCFQVPGEALPAAPLSAAPTETAEAIAAREKAEREAAAKAEAEKRAAAGAEPAGQLTEGNTEKPLPKSYEFKDNTFTVELADGSKKSAKIIFPPELKDKIILTKVGVSPDVQSRDGTACISIEVDKKSGVWLVYQHKGDKFDLIGTDDFYKNGHKLGDYKVSQLSDGNFEIKKVEAKETKIKELHELRKDKEGYQWVVMKEKEKDGKEKSYRFGFNDDIKYDKLEVRPGVENDYIYLEIKGEFVHMDFSRPQKDYPFAHNESDNFFSKYDIEVKGKHVIIKLKTAPAKAAAAPADEDATEDTEDTTEDMETPVDLSGKLKLSELKTVLKEKAGVEASPEEIQRAFRYYQLDGRERGYVKGAEFKKTKAILDGVKKLLAEGSIKPEQLAYVGSVDGTHYLQEKVMNQDLEWHQAKKNALETLRGFIGYNKAIFVPADKKPDEAIKNLMLEYIRTTDLAGAQQVITDHQNEFLEAQGILNMALAVQRAHDLKIRITGDSKASFDTKVEVIRIELGTEDNIYKDRKSGLLFLDENNGALAPERDPDPDIKDEAEPTSEPTEDTEETPPAEDKTDDTGKKAPDSEPTGEEEKSTPAKKPKKKSFPAPAKDEATAGEQKERIIPVKGGAGTVVQKERKIVVGGGTSTLDRSKDKQLNNEKVPKGFHTLSKDSESYIHVLFKNAKGEDKNYKFTYYEGVPHYPEITHLENGSYINLKIDDVNIDLDFSKTQESFPYAWTDRGFLSKYTLTIEGSEIAIRVRKAAPAAAQAKAKAAPEAIKWKPTKETKYFPNGIANIGTFSEDLQHFKGRIINADGTVSESNHWAFNTSNGLWNSIGTRTEGFPTKGECEAYLKHVSSQIGIPIEIFSGDEKYDFQKLWANIVNVTSVINKSLQEGNKDYIKTNKIHIKLNPSSKLWQYTVEGLNGSYIGIDHDNEDLADIAKEINKAVADHKSKNVQPGKARGAH